MRSRPAELEVSEPVERTVTESIAAAGRVHGGSESDVGSSVGGRITALFVKEGDRLAPGDLIAQLDDRTAREQLAQAESAVRTAEAQRILSARKPLSSEIERLSADTEQAVKVAQAKLDAARQRVLELEKGPRQEQIDQAVAGLRQAEAQLETTRAQLAQTRAQLAQQQVQIGWNRRDSARAEALAKDGAISRAEADRKRTDLELATRAAEATARLVDAGTRSVQAAESAVEAAKGRLAELKNGTRPEVLAQARADLAAAESTLAGAKRSGQAQIATLLAQPRSEDIRVAEARLIEARRGVEAARQRLADLRITAPYQGTITRIVVYPGAVAGPNQPVVRIVQTPNLELRADVDENFLSRMRVGGSAVITCDAYPDTRFQANIREIGAQVDSDRGTVQVKLDVPNAPKWLRPGQTVSVNIVLEENVKHLTVPLTALRTVGDRTSVLLVRNGIVVEQEVKAGAPGKESIPILRGINRGDLVVINPVGVVPGTAAKAKKTAEKP
jgi:HlyD family secretion protein